LLALLEANKLQLSATISLLKQITKKHWSETQKTKDFVFRYANPMTGLQWEFRHGAILAIRNMETKYEVDLLKLITFVQREKDPRVRMEQMVTFGELNWQDERVVNLLEEHLQDESQNVGRRAALALAKINASEEIRKKASEFLCNSQFQDLEPEEQRCLAETLGLLKIIDGNAGEILLLLLESEHEEVKRAAGKALSILNV